jgi:hypothetical protein
MGRPALKLVPWETPHKPHSPPPPAHPTRHIFYRPFRNGIFLKGSTRFLLHCTFGGLLTNAESQRPRLSSVSEFLSV